VRSLLPALPPHSAACTRHGRICGGKRLGGKRCCSAVQVPKRGRLDEAAAMPRGECPRALLLSTATVTNTSRRYACRPVGIQVRRTLANADSA